MKHSARLRQLAVPPGRRLRVAGGNDVIDGPASCVKRGGGLGTERRVSVSGRGFDLLATYFSRVKHEEWNEKYLKKTTCNDR